MQHSSFLIHVFGLQICRLSALNSGGEEGDCLRETCKPFALFTEHANLDYQILLKHKPGQNWFWDMVLSITPGKAVVKTQLSFQSKYYWHCQIHPQRETTEQRKFQ